MNDAQQNYFDFVVTVIELGDCPVHATDDKILKMMTRVSVKDDYVDLEDAITTGERMHEKGKMN